MKLKEMECVVVFIPNEKELKELLVIYDKAGWYWMGSTGASDYVGYVKTECKYPVRVTIENNFGTYCMNGNRELTLEEFRKEQGIMKYSEGDVLVAMQHEVKVLGVCGQVYFLSEENDFDNADSDNYTEAWMDNFGYTLKTETTKTDMTVSQLEKKCGLAAGSLNVVAE